MKRRILNLLGGETNLPFMGTFHKFALSILKKHCATLGFSLPLSIYDESESLTLMRHALQSGGGETGQSDAAARVLSKISRIKNGREIVEQGIEAVPQTLRQAFDTYESLLKQKNAVDFDNIILHALSLAKNHPDILANLQSRFRYFLIDEFQDTNSPQYALVKLIARAHTNICVVGDDWQSIYSFRCADFTHLLRFEQEWPGTRVFFLEQNYRSTQTILDASHGVIAQNAYRTEKRLFTEHAGGNQIVVARLADERMEAWWIMERIAEKLKQGCALGDCAVLFRTNVQSRVFEELCMERAIPYQIVGAYRFWQRKEIQDALAYLKCIANPKDSVSMERIINVPKRGIGPGAIQTIKNTGWDIEQAAQKLSLKIGGAAQKFAASMAFFRDSAKTMPLPELIETILAKIGYREWCDPETEQGAERWDNVQELIGLARAYPNEPAALSLGQFLESVQLVQDTDRMQTGTNVLTLMTLHSAKGLEFPIVFIAGVEEGILPHERSLRSPDDIEEERRLLYVGMTRAKNDLFLTCAQHRFIHGEYSANEPSRFLNDIPESLIERVDQGILSSLYDSENTIYL